MPFIRESIVTTHERRRQRARGADGRDREAPFLVIAPFQPSTTLANLRRHPFACVNYATDVRDLCRLRDRRRRDWPVVAAERIDGWRLADALAHAEVEVAEVVDDAQRPRFRCRDVHEASHGPFRGFNRAQAAVHRGGDPGHPAAHAASRTKIEQEMGYLQIAIDKTAGEPEREAWAMADGSGRRCRDRHTVGALAARGRQISLVFLRQLYCPHLQPDRSKPQRRPTCEPSAPSRHGQI